MEEQATHKPIGTLKISEDVLSTIAAIAAKEVEGVASLTSAPAGFKDAVFKSASSSNRCIKIALNADVAAIDVNLILKSGAKIQEVAAAVQNGVKTAVQNMTSIAVSKVNVTVLGVDFAEKTEID